MFMEIRVINKNEKDLTISDFVKVLIGDTIEITTLSDSYEKDLTIIMSFICCCKKDLTVQNYGGGGLYSVIFLIVVSRIKSAIHFEFWAGSPTKCIKKCHCPFTIFFSPKYV